MAKQSHINNLVTTVNRAAREGRIGEEADEAFHDIRDYVDGHTGIWVLEADTLLSSRESEVMVLKGLGLTHNAIRYYFEAHGGLVRTTDDDPHGKEMSVGTVDKYAQRAKKKYERARTTVEELDNLD